MQVTVTKSRPKGISQCLRRFRYASACTKQVSKERAAVATLDVAAATAFFAISLNSHAGPSWCGPLILRRFAETLIWAGAVAVRRDVCSCQISSVLRENQKVLGVGNHEDFGKVIDKILADPKCIPSFPRTHIFTNT